MKLFELVSDGGNLYFYHPRIGESMSVKDAKKMFKGAVRFIMKAASKREATDYDINVWIRKEIKACLLSDGFKEAKIETHIGI